MKKFTQVREQYIGYLQEVIKNNCAYYGSPVAEDILDSLSVKLEQHALLSSLQIDIYENFLTKIICDIEKCTKERQIHNEIKKLLPDKDNKESLTCDKFNANTPKSEKCLETTISNSNDNNLNENIIIWTDQSVQTNDQSPLHLQYSEPCTVLQDSDQLSSLSEKTDDYCDTTSNDKSNFTRKEPEALQSSMSIREASSLLQKENKSSYKNEDINSIN